MCVRSPEGALTGGCIQDANEGEKGKTTKPEKTRKAGTWTTGKSATMFSTWLSKPTAKPSISEPKPTKVAAPSVSDFESSFRPFAVRKNIELAPNNYFKGHVETTNTAWKDIIELNSDGDPVDAIEGPKEKSIMPYLKGTPPLYFPNTFSSLFRFSSPFWWHQHMPLYILQ